MTPLDRAALEREITQLVLGVLHAGDITAIAPDEPLFGERLGLDSIAALALASALQRRYGVTITADAEGARHHFASITRLAAYVAANREPCANA